MGNGFLGLFGGNKDFCEGEGCACDMQPTTEADAFDAGIAEAISALVENTRTDVIGAVSEALGQIDNLVQLTAANAKLKSDLSDMKIQAAEIAAKTERDTLTLNHKIGLERTRQEQEVEIARREAVVTVKEAAVTAATTKLEEQIAFQQTSFDKQSATLEGIMNQLLERFPTFAIAVEQPRAVATTRRGTAAAKK